MPLAADIEISSPDLKESKKILALHGGIPCCEFSDYNNNESIWKEFMNLKDTCERCSVDKSELIGKQILWNDFDLEGRLNCNIFNFYRSCEKIVSIKTLENFCECYKYDFIVRGHTFLKATPIHNLANKCYTIFSASNYMGFDNVGCIAYFDYNVIGRTI